MPIINQTIIRNATILTMCAQHGSRPINGDILIENGRISAIGNDFAALPDAVMIDGKDRLVMPGLINAHTHSSETFFRGRYEGMPLEIWLLYAYPLLMGPTIDQSLLYLRSMFLAMESLRNGVITLCDDFFDPPAHDLSRLSTVFKAYKDANICTNWGYSLATQQLHILCGSASKTLR